MIKVYTSIKKGRPFGILKIREEKIENIVGAKKRAQMTEKEVGKEVVSVEKKQASWSPKESQIGFGSKSLPKNKIKLAK